MKVKELIEKLQVLDQELDVRAFDISNGIAYNYVSVGGIDNNGLVNIYIDDSYDEW